MVEAWRSGCKGCTIYRDGSRSGVMISVSKKDKTKDEKPVDEEKVKDLIQLRSIMSISVIIQM